MGAGRHVTRAIAGASLRAALPALLCLAASPALSAASDPAASRTLTVSITDEKGRPVEGLMAQEVAVIEDGVARPVTRVERDRRPLTVAVVVDSSAPLATAYRLNFIDAVAAFVRGLPEGARYALWTTGDRPRQVVPLTDDRTQAARALRKVFPTGGNMLFDTLVEAAGELGEREAERTVLVAVTAMGIGFANLSRQQAVEQVGRSGAVVMAVQVEDRGGEEYQAAGPDQLTRVDYEYVLSSLTRDTGGLLERTMSTMGTAAGLDRLAAALAGQYRVSYLTPEPGRDAKIQVQVARPGVKARLGASAR